MDGTLGYCCTRAEWETMRLLLELPLPLGLSETSLDEASCRAAYDSLCASGLLTPVGDSVMVDRLYSFLLAEIAESELCLMFRAEKRHVQLFQGASLPILCEWTAAQCTMTPLQTLADAREALANALTLCAAPVTAELIQENTVVDSREYDAPEALQAGLAGIFTTFSGLARG